MSENKIREFLSQTFSENILQSILPKLEELGCEQVEDLSYLETEDIENLGLSKISQKKFLLKIQSLKEGLAVDDDGRQDVPQNLNKKFEEKIEKREEEPEIIRKALVKLNFFLIEKKIGLTDFFRQEKKDSAAFGRMIDEIIIALKGNTGFPYNSLALFTFDRITRMRCLKVLLDKIKQECFMQKRIRFPLETRKMLIWTLLNNCTEELRLQILLLLSQFSSIPLLSLSQTQDNPFELKYNITPEIYWILKPMPAMLCIDIGPKKQTKTINMLFGTDFDEDSYLDHGSVDIQFDLNYKPPKRGFSVLKTDHHIQEKFLYQCIKFSSIHILSVHYDGFEDHLDIIKEFCNKIEKYTQDVHGKLFLIITGFTGQDDLFETKASDIFKQEHGLDGLAKLSVLALPDQSCDNSEMITKIIQKNLITEIQTYLTSESPIIMNHIEFLDNFRITEYEEENKLVENFLNTIEKNAQDFYHQDFLPMYCHYSMYCQTMKKLTGDFQIWQNQNEHNRLEGKLAQLKNIMQGLDEKNPVKPTGILHQFVKVLSKKNSFLLIYAISNRLKVFIDKSLGPEKKTYFDMKEQYHSLKSHHKSNGLQAQLENQLSELHRKLEHKTISLEIIWRELVQFYCYQGKTCFDLFGENNLMQILSKYTQKGLPFEIIDGDNIKLPERFLKTAILPQHKKVLVISIIGPQSSGKSTLLNYLFGCQFATSSGRCTKGIYGTLFDCSFGDYDGLLLLDTEGLFSPEKSDPEYDRKIVLFCFAVSHIVLINVRGDLNRNMQEVLTISLNVLDELKVSKVPSPTIFFVLNQNPDPNIENHLAAFNKIIESLNEGIDVNKMLNISSKTLVVLPSAFSDVSIFDDETTKWRILTPSNIFGDECSNLLNKIWEEAEKRMEQVEDCSPFNNIREWNNFAQDIWSTIENFKGLIYLNEMKEIRQLEQVKTIVLDFIKREFEEDARARELQNQVFTIVKKNDKIDQAELELEHYWENKIIVIKPRWQGRLKDLKLTENVSEKADYFFKSHIHIQKSRSISRLHSQMEEKQARNDTINGEARIKQKIRSILNDHTHEISEVDAINVFNQLFNEITNDMEKRQNIDKIRFKLKSELYTEYLTICKKLPEISAIDESQDLITFDKACFSFKESAKPDVFSQDVFSNKYLNLTSQLLRIEPQSQEGTRVLLALYSIKWSSLFGRIIKLSPDVHLSSVLYELSNELSSIGLNTTGNCYKELDDYRKNPYSGKRPPHPKNNWLTVISDVISYPREWTMAYLDIKDYQTSFEQYLHDGEILSMKNKGIWRTLWDSLWSNKDQPIAPFHLTYYSYETLRSQWLINPIINEISHDELISCGLECIQSNAITRDVSKLVSEILREVCKDSSQITTTSWKFISNEIEKIVDTISKELSQIGLRLTFPGEGKLHAYAFLQILKLVGEKALQEQQKNIKIWIQEKDRLQDFFISQVLVKKSEESDKKLAQNMVKILENEIMHDLKMKAQVEYNIQLEKNKERFTRDTLQSVADAYLINSDYPDLVFQYIMDPAEIFQKEFKKSWGDFLEQSSKDILKIYKSAYYSIDHSIELLQDVVEQLKKAFAQKDEIDIFKIDLADGEEFSEDFSKRVRQAQSEAPFKCLGLFLNKNDFQKFKINGLSLQVDLSLVWNIDINQDEIQQKIIKSFSKESYQTFNLACFLYHFLRYLRELSERIRNITFEEIKIPLQENEMKLLAIGCTRTCPVCGRICDAIHGSNPGCSLDKHECKKGHQYQAMKGVRYIETKEACLETCNDQTDERYWIWHEIHTTWGQMKKFDSLKEWNYDILPIEQSVLNGKFYLAWKIVGKRICEHYNIIYHNNFDRKY